MDSASPFAQSVAGKSIDSDTAVLPMALRFENFDLGMAEFGPKFHGANAAWTSCVRSAHSRTAAPVPSRYRYRRSDHPRATGEGRPA